MRFFEACSALRFWADFTTLNRTSVCMVRSWASSRMMTLYFLNSGSSIASLSSIPSVRYLILVRKLDISSNRTVNPTVVPSWTPISSDTRVAMVIAATLLGYVKFVIKQQNSKYLYFYSLTWVTPIMPLPSIPWSMMNWGICVVLPLPVSPIKINVGCFSTSTINL